MDIHKLKELLAHKGVTVHGDMRGPLESYEVITNGIGKWVPVAAGSATLFENDTEEQVASYLANNFKHFAFHRLDVDVRMKITGASFNLFKMSFCAW
mgnify:CR=1 FL=1